MSERKEQILWPGYVVGWGLFIVVGLPWSLLFVLGERECDMHIGPPCAVSWGLTKLINFAVVIAICTIAGWTTNKLVNRKRVDGDPSP